MFHFVAACKKSHCSPAETRVLGIDLFPGDWRTADSQQTGVSINQWAAYQLDINFLEPKRFAPERWLGDPRFKSDRRDVFQPFSVGPRNCLGRR